MISVQDCRFQGSVWFLCAGLQPPKIRIVLSVQDWRWIGSQDQDCYLCMTAGPRIRIMILSRAAGFQDQDCDLAQNCRFPESRLRFFARLHVPRIRVVISVQDCRFQGSGWCLCEGL